MPKEQRTRLKINGRNVSLIFKDQKDYISLTDIAKYKNNDFPADIVKNWLRMRSTIMFLGLWERLNNPIFNLVEFDQVKNSAGDNTFVLSPKKWIETTKAIGIISRAGRHEGGTFAHKDIAFEFASWVSPEFKLYLIKEFQRLKEEESAKFFLGWNAKRLLTKINYRIHTDAVKNNLIPEIIHPNSVKLIFASEADVLNKALFGMTAKEWRTKNPLLDGNIRDYADIIQLICLANLEVLNAEFIKQAIDQEKRLITLNKVAISQMKLLLSDTRISRLEENKYISN